MTTVPSVPYTFTPTTVAVSGQVNANFAALVTSANLILQGTTTNDNAAAGFIGEYISSDIPVASAVSMTNVSAPYDITSVSLTPGDWDCRGVVMIFNNGKNFTSLIGWISATSATLPTALENGGMMNYLLTDGLSTTPNKTFGLPIASGRVSIAVPTTIYLSAEWSGTGGGAAPKGYGFIGCRRVR